MAFTEIYFKSWCPYSQRALALLEGKGVDYKAIDLTVNKLTEVLLVQLLRADFGRNSEIGVIAALRDKRSAHPKSGQIIEEARLEEILEFARKP